MRSSEFGDVLYGAEDFSYIPRVEDGQLARTLVRDASDDLLLETVYSPEYGAGEDVHVQFAAGDLSIGDLLDANIIEEDDIYEHDVCSSEGFLGTASPSEQDDWTRKRYASMETDGFRYMFEDVDEDVPTRVIMRSEAEDAGDLPVRVAEGLIRFGDYTVESHFEDPYRNNKAPYDPDVPGTGISTVGKRNILENVVDNSIEVSMESLEGDLRNLVD